MLKRSLLVMSIFFVLGTSGVFSQTNELDYILNRTYEQYQTNENRIKDLTFLAESTSLEKKDSGEIEKTVHSIRKVYSKGTNKVFNEYISMEVNGKKLKKEEMTEELKDQKKRGKKSGTWGHSPFQIKNKPYYNYQLIRQDIWNNIPIWVIEFHAREEQERLINGTAYIDQNNFNVLYSMFTPSRLPGVIKKMTFKIFYFENRGFWLPKQVDLEIHVKVKFIFTLAEKHLTIKDQYFDFQVNTGLEDSFFKEDEE